MEFHKNNTYHIFNQGNNKRIIFHNEENYLFFLRKMRVYLLPFADILCYCLMPNHFHWLVKVNEVEIKIDQKIRMGSPKRAKFEDIDKTEPVKPLFRTFNQSIGIMLRSYTRAINKEQGSSGSLFRKKTKSKKGWIDEFITMKRKKNVKYFFSPDNDYAFQCFNYIHNNPVEANLVKKAENWVYSSLRDYKGIRNGKLCNQIVAKEILNLPEDWLPE